MGVAARPQQGARMTTSAAVVDRGEPITLADELERVRLVHRVRRIEQVLSVLAERQRERELSGDVPPGLALAIEGFGAERDRLCVLLAGGAGRLAAAGGGRSAPPAVSS
ncbi:hypothetical protein [Baekduia soli]|uniref:hypothetical protein n=1 Tax=Baekduia soli TaxID=496014 RepID=UPI0016528BA9|nr:hypothetical protein [Baekduia soli]